VKRTALKRTTPLRARRLVVSKKRKQNPELEAMRPLVEARSGGLCEVRTSLCQGRAVHVHHRKLRRHDDHSLSSLLHCCVACHTLIHASVAHSYEQGWLVRSHENPAEIPVRTGS
jgi:hypothetical protein